MTREVLGGRVSAETWRADGGRVSRVAPLALPLHLTRDIRDDTTAPLPRDTVSPVESITGTAGTAGTASEFPPTELTDATRPRLLPPKTPSQQKDAVSDVHRQNRTLIGISLKRQELSN